MITIKIRKWVPIGGVAHTATDYQVAVDAGFTNIVDDHPNDANNLTVYYSQVTIPVNTTYYVRVRRHFSNGTTSVWGDVIAVTNTNNNGGVIAYTKIKVNQPVVSVSKAAVDDPLTLTYTITTSAFNAVGEGHGYTIWSVLNDQNEVIEYVKSTTQLTSITFNKGVNKLAGTRYIRVIAIHGTLTNIESPLGETVINITNVNFKLSTTTDIASAGIDLTVNINRLPNLNNNQLSRIDLVDINGSVLYTTPVNTTDNSVIIPGAELLSDTQYEVIGYGIPATDANVYVLPIKTTPATVLDNIQPGYVYKKTVFRNNAFGIYPKRTWLRGITLPNNTTISLAGGYLESVIRNQDGSFTQKSQFININFVSSAANEVYMRMINNSQMLCIPRGGNLNSSNVYILNINYYNNTNTIAAAIGTIKRSPGRNNSVVFITPNIFYIGHQASTVLTHYEIMTNSIVATDVAIPADCGTIAGIAKDVGGNILLFGMNSNTIYSYDPTTGIYTKKYTLPVAFRGRSLKQEELVNGDVIVWKPVNTETVNGTVVTDTILDILYIDNKTSTISHITPLTGRNYDITGSVVGNDGKVLLLTSETIGTNVIVFE